MGWIIFVCLLALGLVGVGIYNIRSLIRKWKHNKSAWVDLLMGILIWLAAFVAVGWIVVKYIIDNIDYV